MSLLVFDDVRKSFGDTAVLRGVSFEVRPGEVFGLLGPNGAGKTTLMRILLDILRADAGSVRLFGEERRREHLDRVGYLPEERGLYTKQPVLDVMTYFGALKGLSRAESRRRSREWLERVELAHAAKWRVERLSKGMSQKIQIAATLLGDPELCVFDEPRSGLDPVNARFVDDLIRERRDRGRATILSTHQMSQVEALCDRVALIDRGRLMVYGEVGEVRERYSLPEVRIRAAGPPPGVPGVEQVIAEEPGSWRLRLTGERAPADVLADLVARGARIERFDRVLTPMEDIFVRVVQEGAGE
jgi:ABC-2 type transport system ATP-binding protein